MANYSQRPPEWLMPWHAMAEGLMPIPDAVRNVILTLVSMEVDELMQGHGYMRKDADTDADDTKHERYKTVEEKLRNMPHMEAVRQIDRYFRDLTPEARAVLVQQLSIPSIARRAEGAHISPDKYREIKHELPNFLK